MNRSETATLIKEIGIFYPGRVNSGDMNETVKLWNEVLRDEDYDSARKALVEFVRSDAKGYPPLIGQLISIMHPKQEDPFVW